MEYSLCISFMDAYWFAINVLLLCGIKYYCFILAPAFVVLRMR